MSEEYWDGETLVYRVKIENGGGGGGAIRVEIVPGVGNEAEFLYGTIENGDTSSRTGSATFQDPSGNGLGNLQSASIGAGGGTNVPTSSNQMITSGARLIVSGEAKLILQVAGVAAGQDALFGFALRVRGGVPTITEVGNSTPTITIETEEVE